MTLLDVLPSWRPGAQDELETRAILWELGLFVVVH